MSNKFKSYDTYSPLKLEEIPKGKLQVLVKKVGEPPSIEVIEDTLDVKQSLVGGLIEVIPYKDILLICNEEGKILNQKPNIAFDYDYIAGDCFFVGDDYENAGFKSLTREQIIDTIKMLNERSIKYISKDIDEREK